MNPNLRIPFLSMRNGLRDMPYVMPALRNQNHNTLFFQKITKASVTLR